MKKGGVQREGWWWLSPVQVYAYQAQAGMDKLMFLDVLKVMWANRVIKNGVICTR